MVELEPLPEEDAMPKLIHNSGELESHGWVDVLRGNMSGNDKQRLVKLLENHVRYTNSSLAKKILADLDQYLPKFVKVMPVEYKRALQEMSAAATSLSAYTGQGE